MTPRPDTPSRWLHTLLLLALALGGCHGMVVDSLNQRHIASCVWWNSAVSGLRSVSATGGASLTECLAVPCQGR